MNTAHLRSVAGSASPTERRWRTAGDLAVVRVIDTDDGNYGVRLAVDEYERG